MQSVLEKVCGSVQGIKCTLPKSKSGIVVKGIDDVAVRFSRCCNPVPGDEIVGFVTRGRGIIYSPDRLYQYDSSDRSRACKTD